ncbi:hypothetical protein LCGC14_1577700 [marine sediment metagenome]|uniref:Uncharacterized protein n=1 Tax=marine sediment metagenome TaxID=412755 RepID=A0A0F9IHY4_9ZZZZ
MKLKKNQLIEIRWLDITSDGSWLKPATVEKFPAVDCLSVGYFLNQDKKVIRLSSMVNSNDGERDVTAIPLGCVEKIIKLKR